MQYQIRPPAVTSYCHCSSLGSVHRSPTQRASQRMLAVVSPTRVVGDPLPGCPRVSRGRRADLFPSLDRAAVRVAQVPTVSRRRWGNTFSPFRHRPQPAGAGTVSPARFQRLAEPTGESGIGMDLSGSFPFPYQLCHRRIIVHRGRAEQHPRQLLDEDLPIRPGKEQRPSEGVARRRVQHNRAVRRKVAQQPGKSLECLGAVLRRGLPGSSGAWARCAAAVAHRAQPTRPPHRSAAVRTPKTSARLLPYPKNT